jgi:hypothetical protein
MRLQFQRWVTSEVVEQLHDGTDPEQVRRSTPQAFVNSRIRGFVPHS